FDALRPSGRSSKCQLVPSLLLCLDFHLLLSLYLYFHLRACINLRRFYLIRESDPFIFFISIRSFPFPAVTTQAIFQNAPLRSGKTSHFTCAGLRTLQMIV